MSRRRTRRRTVAATLLVLTVPAATGPADPGPATAMPATATPAGGFQPHLLRSPFGTVDAPTFSFPGLTATGLPAADDPPADAVADRGDAAAADGGGAVAMRVAALPDAAADTADIAEVALPAGGDAFRDRRPKTPGPETPGPETPGPETPGPETPGTPGPSTPGPKTSGPSTSGPRTPAELLNLNGDARSRHERCLANAIYFEARGEPLLGQMAVAQVVINRVFSGHYPGNVCGVVYQSTRRYHRLRCQFSFTCDGIPDRVTEPDAFERATRIARNALDGRFWVDDVGKATHYHARWVHPQWVHEMRRLDRIGVHTFYRPRRWGSGATAPAWGDQAATADAPTADP